MNMMTKTLILTAGLVASTSLFARPSGDTVKEVLDYYYQGQGEGAVLVESSLCKEIIREGENRNECQAPLGDTAKVGDSAYVWMKFMVPKGDRVSNILVQANSGGLTRNTQKVDLVGSFRYRTWKKITFDKAGAWDVKVIEDGVTPVELSTLSITIQ